MTPVTEPLPAAGAMSTSLPEGVKNISLTTKPGQSSFIYPRWRVVKRACLFSSADSTKHCKIVDAQWEKSIMSTGEKTPGLSGLLSAGCSEWHVNSVEASVKIRTRIEHKRRIRVENCNPKKGALSLRVLCTKNEVQRLPLCHCVGGSSHCTFSAKQYEWYTARMKMISARFSNVPLMKSD